MKLKQRIRKPFLHFLRNYFNPFTRRLARCPSGPFAIVRHVGRRSGKTYETPIMVQPAEDGFVIELTYGPQVDWYQNVLAAGGCTVLWHAKEYTIDGVEPLDAETGRTAFPLPERLVLTIFRMKYFSKLKTKQ
jgi:deazaflavin-dependent oxidoreductase (nitroreductase family)